MEIALHLLIWLGSGFAFAIGLTLGVCLTVIVTKRGKTSDEVTEAVNMLLRERNQIGHQQVEVLKRIAEAAFNCNE